MKTLKTIFIAIVAIFVFNGCDELLTADIDLPITFTLIDHISVPGDLDPDAKNMFAFEGEYDLLSHPDIAAAIGTPDKIKKVKVKKVLYEFYNFSGNVDAVVTGSFRFPNEYYYAFTLQPGEYPQEIITHYYIGPVKVAEKVISRDQFVLGENFDGFNDYLSQTSIFKYWFIGSSTHNPAVFDIVLSVSATITVEASIDDLGNYK